MQNSIKTIFAAIIILATIISACQNEKKKKTILPSLKLSKESVDFNISFNPENAILYKNHLILFGNDTTNKCCIAAFNLDSNQFDIGFSGNLYNTNITNLVFKNDTLLAYFKNRKSWQFWNNGWEDYNLRNEWFYVNSTGLDIVKHLYEDDKYVVYGVDDGEFGGAVNFYNKVTGKLYVAELYGPNFCTKVYGKYIVNGSLAHMNDEVEIIAIDNPENLFLFPDCFNFYTHKNVGDQYLAYLENCKNNLLPDSIAAKIKNWQHFDGRAYLRARKLIKEKLKIHTIIDSTGLLCFSTIVIDNQLVHFIQDNQIVHHKSNPSLNVCMMQNDSLYVVDKLYDEGFSTYFYSSQTLNNTVLMAFSYWQRKYQLEKMICLIWHDGKLKRFNFY